MKEQTINTLRDYITGASSVNELKVLAMTVQDTLYMRFGADNEAAELQMLIRQRKQFLTKTKSRA